VAWSRAAWFFARGRRLGGDGSMMLGSTAVKSSPPASLGIAVAVDVPLGGLDRPGGGGKDEEASCLRIGEYFACFPAITNCSSTFATQLTIAVISPQSIRLQQPLGFLNSRVARDQRAAGAARPFRGQSLPSSICVSFIPKAMETEPQTIDKSRICLTPSHCGLPPTLWLLATFAPGPLKNGETHKAKNL
jgi:hypothetical protein